MSLEEERLDDDLSEPISDFHAGARKFMDEYRDTLDALDE